MKKNKFNLIIIILVLILTVLVYIILNSRKVPCLSILNSRKDPYLSILYTNKDYVSTYGTYDLGNNKFKSVYVRKKEGYSDIVIDKKKNTLFYSGRIDGVYSIAKVDLSENNDDLLKLVNGDIFDVYNNILFFRSLQPGHHNYLIGSYNLTTGEFSIWNNTEMDSTILNFYFNFLNKKIYTIEYSLSEAYSTRFPDIPINKIMQYNETGTKARQIYASNKFINNISVNKVSNKILFDAASYEDNEVVNKIYLIDLNTSKEEVLLEPNDIFKNDTFALIKNPQFSINEKGFYFLGTTSSSKIIEELEGTTPTRSNAIYYYEFSTKKLYKIFENPNVFINRFKLQI